MNESTYENLGANLFGSLFRPQKPVAHQQTCPACGRTLVNLYRRDGVWKCKGCWDAEGGGGEG